ncbi:class II aldolase [Cladophialophora carrionii]|uniref:Class II aldolase n=1 Tax=Cladophialophora carrionii TaxID=86049 RepID=A0A1C1CVL7_9EURO|nr:class II aldolase [Cladophialophora carrionii]
MVSSPADLIHYNVSDSSPVDPHAQKGYSERFIHGEIFKRFGGGGSSSSSSSSSVNCVIHSHAEEVLPYVVSMGVKLKAVYHMSGFLGSQGVKVFDIAPLYRQGEQQDMLVNNARFGAALAEKFVAEGSDTDTDALGETVVLMRRHGFTVVGGDLVTAVYRAIYTRINAEAQTKAMSIARSGMIDNEEARQREGMGFQALTAEQVVGCSVMNEAFHDKPWRLWVREVERLPLYENRLSESNRLD